MLLQTPFPAPPFPPDSPPGPVFQLLCLLAVLGFLAELLLLALPEPWARAVIRAALKGVWPFTQVDAWLRQRIR